VGDRKTWAIILGTTAGVAIVSLAATCYVKSHRGEPLMQDAQSMISDAYNKIKNLEQALTKWHGTEETA
jgi:hypothetical protein